MFTITIEAQKGDYAEMERIAELLRGVLVDDGNATERNFPFIMKVQFTETKFA